MKILHLNGFSDQEKLSYKEVVHGNTISSIKSLINACQGRIEDASIEPGNVELAAKIKLLKATDLLTPEVAQQISAILQDSGIKKALSHSNEFQMLDSGPFYFQSLDRLSSPSYIPTEEDILRSRQMTTGIIETEWDIQDEHFRMIDVGGQRNHRNKWIHCFDKVTAVIFCVAISEYDQVLREDEETNRMMESLALFETLVNSNWFQNTSFLIFFNKMDLFEEKIKHKDLTCCFPDYPGGKNADAAKEYIQKKFLATDKFPQKRSLFSYFTCATDTTQIRTIFDSVRRIIVSKILVDSIPGLDQ